MEGNWSDGLGEFWAAAYSVAWLEWAKAIFDLLKGVAWPLAVFMLVWLFRHQIRERIKDLVSAGPAGVVLQGAQSTQTSSTSLSTTTNHPMQTVMTTMERIESELASYQESLKIPTLIRALAEVQVARLFEVVFSDIYGSQITALRHLKAQKEISVDDAKKFFDDVVKPMNEDLYSIWGFDDWSSFLFRQELARRENGKIFATDRGIDFVYFVDKAKPGIPRPN
ncbi:hypothetical protein [Sinorhizobium chiapasense]|uniref:Uncharacterized protein n=1 Tax=Sinorhizobium chiapasense TaxID=501572 RepID=A0ABZ2BDC4_9HYPH